MIREEFKVLTTLQDLKPSVTQEVKKSIQDGKLDDISCPDLVQAATKCFIELNFLSAAAIFERGFDRFKDNSEFLWTFGYFLYECQFLELSKQMLETAIGIDPELDPRAYFTIGAINVNNPGIALKPYLKGLDIAEKMGEALQNEIESFVGADLSRENQVRQSKIQSKLRNMKREVAQAYCAVAELLMNVNEFPKNSKDIEHALSRAEHFDSDYFEYVYQKAMFFFNIQDEQNCRAQIAVFVQKMRELEAKEDNEEVMDYSSTMLVSLVRMMIEGAIYEDGAFLADIACSNDPLNIEAWYMSAFCYMCLEDKESCKESLMKLKTLDFSQDQELKGGFEELCAEFQVVFKEKLDSASAGGMDQETGGDGEWEDVE
jgi:tetratricopeptide (TPR) repeat protein